MKTYLIGCGGSGGWLAQLFAKSPCDLVLVDGDTIEKRNLDRQLFTRKDIKKNNATALSSRLSETFPPSALNVFDEYLAAGSRAFKAIVDDPDPVCLLAAVDNHPARRLCYHVADERRYTGHPTVVISAANEFETASAWVYLPEWQDTALDPRVRWPEILVDNTGDPLRPPCTGEVLASAPQLALSNMVSAASAAWLHRFWTVVQPGFRASMSEADYRMLIPTFPVWVDWTNGRQTTKMIRDLVPAKEIVTA